MNETNTDFDILFKIQTTKVSVKIFNKIVK